MEKCTSIIIDSALKNSKGHYEQFSYDFRQALIRSGKKVIYISPSADLANKSDGVASPLISYQFIDAISKPSFFQQSFQVVKKMTKSSPEKFHIIFLRANDLAAGNVIDWSKFIEDNQQIDLKVLINVSGMISDSSHSESEREVLNKLGIFKDKIHFMAWDSRVTESREFSSFDYLPLYKKPVKKSSNQSQLRIGFFGKLTSDRGLTDLLFSAILNPQLKFELKGYGLSFKYLYRCPGYLSVKKTPIKAIASLFLTLYIFLLTKLPNVSLSEIYFDTEQEMTAEIQKCSAIFWSCRKSPYESGIVIQSLAAGVPVVWLNGQSAMAKILSSQYPVGELPIKKLYQFRGMHNFVLSVKELAPSVPFTFEEFQSVASKCNCP
jgi:hypothetical protein